MDRWIILWHDKSGDADRDMHVTGDTGEETTELIGSFLQGEKWMDPATDEEMPAAEALLYYLGIPDAAALPATLQNTVGDIILRCEGGILTVIRDRSAR
jgi:hypothetical protein